MNYLLDTHTILWFLNGEKLSEKTTSLILAGTNFISVVSLWEVAIKMNIGKFTFEGGFSVFLRLVKENGFVVLPIKNEYMKYLFQLPLLHREPYDRLIISTAVIEELTLITKDENIQKYEISWIW